MTGESLAIIGIMSTVLVTVLGVGIKMVSTLAHIMKTSERIYDRLEDESAEHVKLTERQAAQAQADVEILQLQRDTLQILRDVGGMIKELKRELQELRLIMIDRQ